MGQNRGILSKFNYVIKNMALSRQDLSPYHSLPTFTLKQDRKWN